MEFIVEKIQEIDLPNYMETISSGDDSYSREAPLLAKYQVDIKIGCVTDKLYFEVREQPNAPPLIDGYYEDQVYETLHKLLSSVTDEKEKITIYNDLVSQLTMWVFEVWEGKERTCPILYEVNI